ncbi:MAG: single-stranded-DNA-specific exonuclease RecJ [Caldiserica bacterium]|nr:single-stranded-DNA-specific exonuclease RecJ [Caldisericota bacterium]
MVWKIRKKNDPYEIEKLVQSLRISPLTAEMLLYRGVTTVEEARKFLYPSLDALLPPSAIPDIEKAKYRIEKAVENREKILLYGDYDADGITGTALLYHFFKKQGIVPEVYIPHRIEEGYGFHREAVEKLSEKGFSLIITIDCGTEGEDAACEAAEKGIDLVICDHHIKEGNLPPAYALINPHIHTHSPGKELAGCGIAFKLLQSLDEEEAFKHLDLVTVGTVADIVPVIGDNRILVKEGLLKIAETSKKGLRSLLEICGLKKRKITAWDISFLLAPRLNAGGRMTHALKSLSLLLSNDEEAREIALSLELDNRNRKKVGDNILKEAGKLMREREEESALVLAGEGWHAGVLGIIASRLVDKYSRPAFVISLPPDKSKPAKGSARSIPGINLFNLLKESHDLLLTYGGHEKAGGFEILPEKINVFRERILSLIKDIPAPEEKTLLIDKEVSLDTLTFQQIKELSLLSPFGEGNEEPLLLSRKVKMVTTPRPLGNGHIKFWVKGEKLHLEVLGFGWKDKLEDNLSKGREIDIVYTPRTNNWEGRNSVVLILQSLKISSR